MREIKFRGKRIDDGKWVYGDLLQYRVYPVIFDEEKEQHEVSADTVCQYLGFKDKNKKELYEGDIIFSILEGTDKGDEELFEAIEFADGAYRVVDINYCKTWKEFKKIFKNEESVFDKESAKECELIGNIFDNPEYLEGRR